MASATNTNGQVPRKTLASQLDRLDSIIDALANGLNETVADVMRQAVTVAVTQAVETVLREVLTHPELLRQLAGQVTPPTAAVVEQEPAKPSRLMKVLAWIGKKLSSAGVWIGTKLGNGWAAVCEQTGRLPLMFQGLGQKIRNGMGWLWERRRPVAVSLLIGLVVGGIGYAGGPVIASAALGLCSSAMSLAGFVAAPFIRLWKRLQMQSA